MWRISRTAAVLAGVMASTLWVADGTSAEPAVEGHSEPIVIHECRLKLMDQADLASDRVGILDFVEPEEGDAVTRGQQVAGLRDDVAEAALATAEKQAQNDIEVRFAIKAAEVAEVEHKMSVEANRRSANSIAEMEIRRLLLASERSLLQVEQSEHQMEINKLTRDEAQAELATYQVVAPFDGVVTRVYRSRGQAVRQGDPILELTSTARVRVEGYVDIADVWDLRAGAPVEVQLDIAGVDLKVEEETFAGRIVFVDVTVQPVTGQVRVWAEVANRDNILRAGLTATMTIQRDGAVGERSALRPTEGR